MFKLELSCECDVQICDHTTDMLSELIQAAFDEGFDHGWREAFEMLHQGLVERKFEGAEKLKAPPPPPRKAKKARFHDSKRAARDGEYNN